MKTIILILALLTSGVSFANTPSEYSCPVCDRMIPAENIIHHMWSQHPRGTLENKKPDDNQKKTTEPIDQGIGVGLIVIFFLGLIVYGCWQSQYQIIDKEFGNELTKGQKKALATGIIGASLYLGYKLGKRKKK